MKKHVLVFILCQCLIILDFFDQCRNTGLFLESSALCFQFFYEPGFVFFQFNHLRGSCFSGGHGGGVYQLIHLVEKDFYIIFNMLRFDQHRTTVKPTVNKLWHHKKRKAEPIDPAYHLIWWS